MLTAAPVLDAPALPVVKCNAVNAIPTVMRANLSIFPQ
jgi:hypothetical protein